MNDGDPRAQPTQAPTERNFTPSEVPPSLSEPSRPTGVMNGGVPIPQTPGAGVAVQPQQTQQLTSVPIASPDRPTSSASQPQVEEPSPSLSEGADDDDTVVSWTSDGEGLMARAQAWRVRMSVLSVIVGILVFFITGGDWVSSIVIAFAGIAFGFLGSRKPQSVAYQLDHDSIVVGRRQYELDDFRAFSLIENNISASIELLPLHRFAPMLSVQLDRRVQDQVLGILSAQLPFEEHHEDMFDQLLKKIKI